MTEHLSDEREQEIRESIPTSYGPPWTVHPDTEDDTWRVMYATDNPLAGLVAVVPDYGSHLAEFIATSRAAVPELLAEVERLRVQLAEERASSEQRLPESQFSATSCVEIKCLLCEAVLDEDGDGTMHFPSQEEAVRTARAFGWTELADGRVICGDDVSDDHVQARNGESSREKDTHGGTQLHEGESTPDVASNADGGT